MKLTQTEQAHKVIWYAWKGWSQCQFKIQEYKRWKKKYIILINIPECHLCKKCSKQSMGLLKLESRQVHWVHSRALRACLEPAMISSTAQGLIKQAVWSHSGTYSFNVECKFCCLIEVVIGATHLRAVSVKVYIIWNSNYLLFCRWPEQCRPCVGIEYLAGAYNHIEMQSRVTGNLK